MTMKQKARDFVLEYLKRNRGGVNTLDTEFMDAFINETGAKSHFLMVGAPVCKYANKTLSDMYLSGILDRSILGLTGGAWMPGFPKWVYDYQLKEKATM